MRHSYKYRHIKRDIQHKYDAWGFKFPLYQIDKKFGYSNISPNGFYTLTFVSPEHLRSFVTYIDIDNENYKDNWKHICENENNYYVLTNLIEEVKRNKPTISKNPMYDHVVDADSKSNTECVVAPDDMRIAVMEAVQDSLKKQEQQEQEQEAKSKPEGYEPGLFYEVEKGN
jgi:hypothetical protein